MAQWAEARKASQHERRSEVTWGTLQRVAVHGEHPQCLPRRGRATRNTHEELVAEVHHLEYKRTDQMSMRLVVDGSSGTRATGSTFREVGSQEDIEAWTGVGARRHVVH